LRCSLAIDESRAADPAGTDLSEERGVDRASRYNAFYPEEQLPQLNGAS